MACSPSPLPVFFRQLSLHVGETTSGLVTLSTRAIYTRHRSNLY